MKDVISVDSNSKSEDTLPENSIHEPLSDNPSPSKGLLKATEPPQDSSQREQDTSLDDTNKALERAFKDYRIGCDMALSERDDGVYTQAEYEEAIMWELDNAISFVHEIYSSLLKQQQIKLIERIEGVNRTENDRGFIYINEEDFMEAIKMIKDNVINGGSL